MQVKNRRPMAVEIAAPNFDFFADVEPSGVVEVPDDLGKSLLEQPDNWAAVPSKPKE